MNVPMGFAALKRVGGRATVREVAEWSEAPRDPGDAETEGYARGGLFKMMAELEVLGAHQVTPGALDAVIEIDLGLKRR